MNDFTKIMEGQLETYEALNRINAQLTQEHEKADIAIQKQNNQIEQAMLDLKKIKI